ncbi:MAG: TadA family conjugal transfer-associated ATPase [Micrococcaceae bacterium]
MQPWIDNKVVEPVRQHLLNHNLDINARNVVHTLEKQGYIYTAKTVLKLVEQIEAEFSGLAPLKPLLAITGVTDIFVNGHAEVWLDKGLGLERYPLHFGNEERLCEIAIRLVNSTGRRLDDSQPAVDARLANGIRIHAVLPPLSPNKTLLSLRVPHQQSLNFENLITSESINELLADILYRVIKQKKNFLISGATGSGKTALLCALLELTDTNERLLIVEDSSELFPTHPHVVHLEAQQKNIEGSGEIVLQDLVKHALRMRPDRLIVGEYRGAEIKDLLHAFNTGHSGGRGTIHANSTKDLPARLEALCALAGLEREAAWAQINSALDLAIHVANENGKRFVSEITLVNNKSSGEVTMLPALSYDGSNIKELSGYQQLTELLKK